MKDNEIKRMIRWLYANGIATGPEEEEKQRRKLKVETWRVKQEFSEAMKRYHQTRK